MGLRVELIVGPMFSGKSGELRRRCNRLMSIGRSVLYCKPRLDSSSTGILARDFETQPTAIPVDNLLDVSLEALDAHDVVAIDEGQFIADLAQFVGKMHERYNQAHSSKIIIIAGLNGDSEQKQWEPISAVMPLADDAQTVYALCARCSTPTVAPFTRCLTSKEGQVAIRSEACQYIPVCRKHQED